MLRQGRGSHPRRSSFGTDGVRASEVSRYAGTSVPMIDQHYGHLAIGHEDAARAKLNARFGA
jgi:hypothetical protein